MSGLREESASLFVVSTEGFLASHQRDLQRERSEWGGMTKNLCRRYLLPMPGPLALKSAVCDTMMIQWPLRLAIR
jgi:hypothetical protein